MKILIATLWAISVLGGLISLYIYELTPGPEGNVVESWDPASKIKKETDYQLLIFLHPHCPCSRATVRELAIIMTKAEGKLRATALFLQPSSFDENWVKSNLWHSAKIIPGLTTIIDYEGEEAKRFGATTSGQTLLYNSQGELVFNGGITGSRGHEGSNLGSSSIINIVQDRPCETFTTPYFGCPLFHESSLSNNRI